MKKLFKLLLTIAIAMSLAFPAFADFDLGFAREDGGRPGAFLAYGAGVRSLAMGRAYTSVSNDASAVYSNPAGLMQLDRQQITMSHSILWEETSFNVIAFAIPLGRPATSGQESVKTEPERQNIELRNDPLTALRANEPELRTEATVITGSTETAVSRSDSVSEEAITKPGLAMGKASWWREGVLGFGLVNLNSGNFDKRDYYNKPIGTADLSENALLVSYAIQPKNIMYGATVKIIQQKIDTYSGLGLGADIGALYGLTDAFWIGANLQNIIPPMIKLNSDTDQYPVTMNFGASYNITEKIMLSSDLIMSVDRNPKIRLGAEYAPMSMFALRAGINETEITAGFGITYKDFEIGYAFSFHDAVSGYADLGASHRFGITYSFGNSVNE